MSGYAGLGMIMNLYVALTNGEGFFRDPLGALMTVSGVVLVSNLLALLILKILAIVDAWGTRPMRKRVDIALCGPVRPWWRYPAKAIFGVKLWEARIP
jgi:hypothetical protein